MGSLLEPFYRSRPKTSELLDSIVSAQYILHYCLELEELREIIWKARREADRKPLLGVAERAKQAAQFLINNRRLLRKFSHANLLLTEEYLADVDIGETEAYREVLVPLRDSVNLRSTKIAPKIGWERHIIHDEDRMQHEIGINEREKKISNQFVLLPVLLC